MPEANLELGRVYGVNENWADNGNVLSAAEYFPQIGEFARQHYNERNRLTSERHDAVVDSVDELIVQHLGGYANHGLRVLDIGGSNGRRLSAIEKNLGAGLDKHLVDIDHLSIEDAVQNGITSARVLDITQQKLPYDSGFFDAVNLLWVMEHVPPDKQEFVISEAHRVLKPSGKLYLQAIKYGADEKEENYFKEVLDPKKYEKGTFHLAMFKTLLSEEDLSNAPESEFLDELPSSVHRANDVETDKYERVGPAMYVKSYTTEELEGLVGNHFNFESIYFIEFDQEAGKVIPTNLDTLKTEHANDWGVFFTVLSKK